LIVTAGAVFLSADVVSVSDERHRIAVCFLAKPRSVVYALRMPNLYDDDLRLHMDWGEMMEDSDLFSETPTQLIPKMGEFPVSNSAFYWCWDPQPGKDKTSKT